MRNVIPVAAFSALNQNDVESPELQRRIDGYCTPGSNRSRRNSNTVVFFKRMMELKQVISLRTLLTKTQFREVKLRKTKGLLIKFTVIKGYAAKIMIALENTTHCPLE